MVPSRHKQQGSPSAEHPLLLRWDRHNSPLPVRELQIQGKSLRKGSDRSAELGGPVLGDETRPHSTQSERGTQPLDFCAHMHRLCADIAARSAPFWHLDVSRLLFAVTQARNNRRHGLQARLTPLRFRHGALVHRRRQCIYQVQRYQVDGREMLYLVTFCLPRFLDQPFQDKLVTVFHELYHISPAFDGDFRRHKGRYRLHSHSQLSYDAQMQQFVQSYLHQSPPAELFTFLKGNFAQLQERYGSILGVIVPRPKIVPVMTAQGQAAHCTVSTRC